MSTSEKLKNFINMKSNARYLQGKKLKTELDKDPEALMKFLFDEIENIHEEELKESLRVLVTKDKNFPVGLSSTGYHHAYEGGNLEHTTEVLRFALLLAKDISVDFEVDLDLVRAGAILHDFGKRKCYEIKNDRIDGTWMQYMNSHIVQGIMIASKHIKSSKADKLNHIIASHHNIPEWGSPVRPNTIEAWIVHLADQVSSKLYG